jgi:hypothetical protein
VFRLFASLDFAFVEISGDGSDFYLEIRLFPVEGFLVIELGLQADEEVAEETEAELGAEGEVGAWFRFHGRLISVSVFDSDEFDIFHF